MSGKEKLYFLLNRIDDARAIAPAGQPILLHPINNLNDQYSSVELMQLFRKLEKDEKVLKVLNDHVVDDITVHLDPYRDFSDAYYRLYILPAFDEYYSKIQEAQEYQDFTGKRQKNKQVDQLEQKKVVKYERKALEKIWNVLQEIEEKRQLSADGDPVRIDKFVLDQPGGRYEDRESILKKLYSEKAIDMLSEYEVGSAEYWLFGLTPEFHEIMGKYEELYKGAADYYNTESQSIKEIRNSNQILEISYTDKREVVLNGFYRLSKPNFNSENDVVFAFLSENPNKTHTIHEIEEAIGETLNKDLHKIVENLGFTGALRNIFFKVSKTEIYFRNPVTDNSSL